MDYLDEILAFEQWIESNCLSPSSQLLWYKLMYFCSRSGWSKWVTIDSLRLMAATRIRREDTFTGATDELIKAGLVECWKGKKGIPNRYRMISVVEKSSFQNKESRSM